MVCLLLLLTELAVVYGSLVASSPLPEGQYESQDPLYPVQWPPHTSCSLKAQLHGHWLWSQYDTDREGGREGGGREERERGGGR